MANQSVCCILYKFKKKKKQQTINKCEQMYMDRKSKWKNKT